MGDLDWQVVVALVAVAVAALSLGRRVRRLVKGKQGGACGTSGCGSCSANVASQQNGRELPLVTLENTPTNNFADRA
jgi:Na+-translocating ferredoxin:NAD+ oxidoreductase RNF subunit RnfB